MSLLYSQQLLLEACARSPGAACCWIPACVLHVDCRDRAANSAAAQPGCCPDCALYAGCRAGKDGATINASVLKPHELVHQAMELSGKHLFQHYSHMYK